MKHILRIFALACALALLPAAGVARAEDMPVIEDTPLSDQEQADLYGQAQQLLIDLGYLTGKADGILGPRSAAALKAFQKDEGLDATGKLDPATLEALTEMADTVAEAKAIQQRLIDLGYLRGKADGIFGERSRAALTLFQTMNRLDATGAMDDATRAALFDEAANALPERLTGGSKGDAVTALQEKLTQFGFMTGKVDGSYGKATAAAVQRFQKHLLAQGVDEGYGIAATGEATPATQVLLFDPAYSTYLNDVAPGDTGDEAERVERRLSQLGYMDLAPDDTFDDYGVRCAQAFQSAAGLEPGVFDKAAVDALFADEAPAADAFVPHAVAKGDSGQAVRAAEEELVRLGLMIKHPNRKYDDSVESAVQLLGEALADQESEDAALFADAALLTEEAQAALPGLALEAKASDAQTRRVQRRLYTLYYLGKGGIDGKYGSGSAKAMQAFQDANGLPVNGKMDEATLAALFSSDARSNPRPYRVEVDIDRQRVYVFELNDAGEYEQTHEFICSTGLGDRTPRGVYLDGFPVNRWHYFKDFDCWAQYSFEIEGNIMFHSVIYSSNDTSTVRQNSVYTLGSKASHGCVRLPVEDAKWLFEHCKRGSLIIVIY